MGNLSSCSAAPSAVKSSTLVTSVLLVDGSMLKFRSPMKVIHLLLDYPNHVVCPLDSLKPGLHSLSSLLPDENLQLGRLYLLLPFKTHLQQSSCAKSKQVMQRHHEDPKKHLPETGKKHSQMFDRDSREERARLLPREEMNVGFVDREKSHVRYGKYDKLNRDGGVRDPDYKLQSSTLAREEQVPERVLGTKGFCEIGQKKEKQGFMRSVDLGSSKCASSGLDLRHDSTGKRSAASYGKLYAKRRGKEGDAGLIPRDSSKSRNVISPLCDTPELQRAYRSLLRRSSSWTPRLQPILERR